MVELYTLFGGKGYFSWYGTCEHARKVWTFFPPGWTANFPWQEREPPKHLSLNGRNMNRWPVTWVTKSTLNVENSSPPEKQSTFSNPRTIGRALPPQIFGVYGVYQHTSMGKGCQISLVSSWKLPRQTSPLKVYLDLANFMAFKPKKINHHTYSWVIPFPNVF